MSKTRTYDPKAVDAILTPYRGNVSNQLGIEAVRQRSMLKTFALSEPAKYSAVRDGLYTDIVEQMVAEAHATIWLLLAKGIKPDGTKMQLGTADWAPNLPDQEISNLANGYSSSVMDAFTEILDKVFPDDYRKLADEKQMHIAKLDVMQP